MRRTTALRTIAVCVLMTLIAAACAGSDPSETDTVAGDESEAAVGVISTPVPTTAPIVQTEEEIAASEALAEAFEGAEDELDDIRVDLLEDPNEVTVLHVIENAPVIPTFDGPNGNQVTLFDENIIDGETWEYPLTPDTHFGNRLALLVEEFDSTGNWARVQVPVRPNGTTTWVQTAFFTQETHNFRIVIDLTERLVNVYEGDELIIEQLAGIGRENRPTPLVRSFIDEKIPGPQVGAAFGDWILSIAAFSTSIGTFGGGTPKLAIHGTNQPDLIGQEVSSGCVRLPNEIISLIAETVPVGTVVDIIA